MLWYVDQLEVKYVLKMLYTVQATGRGDADVQFLFFRD
jgi:hypothetical protein